MTGCKGGALMTSGKVHQFLLGVSVSCLFGVRVHMSSPLSAVSTEMGERSFRVEFSPNLSSPTRTRCVLLGSAPIHFFPLSPPTTDTPPPTLCLSPPPNRCSPFLKLLCLWVPPSYRLRPGFKDGLCTAAAVPVGSDWNRVPAGSR